MNDKKDKAKQFNEKEARAFIRSTYKEPQLNDLDAVINYYSVQVNPKFVGVANWFVDELQKLKLELYNL